MPPTAHDTRPTANEIINQLLNVSVVGIYETVIAAALCSTAVHACCCVGVKALSTCSIGVALGSCLLVYLAGKLVYSLLESICLSLHISSVAAFDSLLELVYLSLYGSLVGIGDLVAEVLESLFGLEYEGFSLILCIYLFLALLVFLGKSLCFLDNYRKCCVFFFFLA